MDRSFHDWIVEVKFLWLEFKWWTKRAWTKYVTSIPARIRQGWYRLWVRKDEFHESLSLDIDYYQILSKDDRIKYMKDLVRRREIAHQRDLERN